MTSNINVLYVDGDGPLGGASRSLYELINGFEPGAINSYFFVSSGTASIFYSRVAKDVISVRGMTKFDHTKYGFYRGLRWLILLREIFHFPFMLVGLFKVIRKWKNINLIHLNEFVYIIPAIILKMVYRVPLVVHVRSLTKINEQSNRSRFIRWVLKRYADVVIAIDGNVKNTMPEDMDVVIVNNSFSPVSERDYPVLTSKEEVFIAGYVGNLHRSKGVFEIIEAAKIIKNNNVDFKIFIAGGETLSPSLLRRFLLRKLGFAQNIMSDLEVMINQYGLEDNVILTGQILDVGSIYNQISVLLFPSHFDAPGRPVFEAGFFSKPSIVAASNPTPDTFVNMHTGILIRQNSPQDLADAITFLIANPDVCRYMGDNAKELAEKNFNPVINSKIIFSLYGSLLSKAG